MKNKRSLYQCLNAKVLNDRIYCNKGYKLRKTEDGGLNIKRLARGAPLKFLICQDCPDYDEMGPPIPEGERGWVTL